MGCGQSKEALLLESAACGDFDGVRYALESGANPNGAPNVRALARALELQRRHACGLRSAACRVAQPELRAHMRSTCAGQTAVAPLPGGARRAHRHR